MRIWTRLAIWSVLAVAKVRCDQENPFEDSQKGVWEIIPGSHVIIGCCGDVYVNCTLQVRQSPNRAQGVDCHPAVNYKSGSVKTLVTNQVEGGNLLPLKMVSATAESTSFSSCGADGGSQWTMNGQPLSNIVGRGKILTLPFFDSTDIGNYSCHSAGRQMSLVGLQLKHKEFPSTFTGDITRDFSARSPLTCRRKFPEGRVRCYWYPPALVTQAPKCHLINSGGIQERERNEHDSTIMAQSSVRCRYSHSRSRCRCTIRSHEWDSRSDYFTMLVVTHPSGNQDRITKLFTPENVLRPDPPEGVLLMPNEYEEHSLNVSWSYPNSWTCDNYYFLKFELRYRPVGAHKYQMVEIPPGLSPTCHPSRQLMDIMANMSYEVQLRAREEHDQSRWSDWSLPVFASPWTAPKASETSSIPDIAQEPPLLMTIPSDTEQEIIIATDLKWVQYASILSGCLAVALILVFFQVIRKRAAFQEKLDQLGVVLSCPGSPSMLSLPQ